MEQYKPISGYEGIYEVSNLGNVRRIAKYRNSKSTPLKAVLDANGYLQVSLCRDNKPLAFKVHRLVADAFLSRKPGLEVNHKNGDKADANLSNLEFVTKSENQRHRYHVLYPHITQHNAKIKKTDAIEIRNLYKKGWTQKSIGIIFGISQVNVSRIVRNVIWVR